MGSCRLLRRPILLSLLLGASTWAAPSKDLPWVERDTIPRIAVVSAFDAELAKLRDSAQLTGRRILNGRTVWIGRLRGHDVVLLLSGFSMINATMTSQALVDQFRIEAVVFSGIAGGVNPGLRVGDVTVPARWGSYQEQVFGRKTDSGFDPGHFKGEFGNFGMMFPRSASVPVRGAAPDSLESKFWFPVDTTFLRHAGSVAGELVLKKCTSAGDCLDHQPKIVTGGNGVSGPTFVDNAEYRAWVWKTFSADALDMETSAVAHVAYVNRVPFIAFRSLSDLAGGGPGKNEGRTFGKLAADNSATVVLSFLNKLPTNGK
jgi:adenosylhomocysteine nucleosidase